MKQEKYLKTGQQKEIIKRKYIDKNEILFLVGWPSG